MKQAGAIANWAQPAYFVVLFICFLAAALAAVNLPGNSLLVLNGHTMGTRYRILLDSSSLASVAARSALQTAIDERLHQLDKGIFSTYESTSELSTLNQATVGEALVVSADLANVIESAKLIHEKSAGAFDVSLKPLVDLWGFGGTDTPREIPDKTRLEKALAKVGMNAVEVQGEGGNFSVTRHKAVALDLSALAKGYAVDQLALLLESSGLQNYLVEIGGEVISRGLRPDSNYWRIGIERPVQAPPELFRQIKGSRDKMAIATSGSYQNYFVIDNRRYSHVINPVTGWPISHDLVSVTVLHSSAMTADAWATALLILGAEEGMKLANALQLPVYFIVDDRAGLSGHSSDAFKRYL